MKIIIRRGTKQSSFEKYAKIKVASNEGFDAFNFTEEHDYGEFDISSELGQSMAIDSVPSYYSKGIETDFTMSYDNITITCSDIVKIEDTINIIITKIRSRYDSFITQKRRIKECEKIWGNSEDQIINLSDILKQQ